jgi:hypothetical protein
MDTFATRLSRRSLLRGSVVAGIGAGALALVGCGDDDDDAPTPAAAATKSNGDQAKKLVHGWYRGREVTYYDFGGNSKLASTGGVASAPIYVFIRGSKADGSPDALAAQHNVVGVLPGDASYSDLWQVNLVTVPATYTADSAKSVADITSGRYDMKQTDMFVNCPIVAEGTKLERGEPIVQGWKDGKAVFYPDFGLNAAVAIPIWVFITGMDDKGMPKFVKDQRNIVDAIPADRGYSAFWQVSLVTVPESYVANAAKSAEDVQRLGFKVTQTEMVVNCPIVGAA